MIRRSRSTDTIQYIELHVKTVKYFKSIERVQDEVEAMHAEFRTSGGTDIVGGME